MGRPGHTERGDPPGEQGNRPPGSTRLGSRSCSCSLILTDCSLRERQSVAGFTCRGGDYAEVIPPLSPRRGVPDAVKSDAVSNRRYAYYRRRLCLDDPIGQLRARTRRDGWVNLA